jgi:hypothetical protein
MAKKGASQSPRLRSPSFRAAMARNRQRQKIQEGIRDQFAALGRFVQSFEDIVSALRWHCHRIMLGDHLGIPNPNPDPKAMVPWWNINSLVFHHESVTAKVLLDMWRALLAEQCNALSYRDILSDDGVEAVRGVSGEIAADFADICQNRNLLIHATWQIGHWFSNQSPSDIRVFKYKVTQDGLLERKDLPKNTGELIELGTRCQKLHMKLGRFLQHYHYQPNSIDKVFKFSKKADKWQKWNFVPPATP